MAKGKTSRWARRIALILLLALAAVFAVAWMMFQHIPAWYQPPVVPLDRLQAVRDDFVVTFDRLSEALNTSPSAFEFRLTQDQVNGWLAAREQIWPACRKWLPSFIEDPMLIIESDGLRLAAVLRRRSLRSVLSAKLSVHVDSGGLAVRLVDVAGGDLPLPKSEIRKLLADLETDAWPTGQRIPGQIGNRPLPPLGSVFEGIVLPNEWVWANGRQPFRVTRVVFEPGVAVLTLEPLSRQNSGRSQGTRTNSPGVLPPGS